MGIVYLSQCHPRDVPDPRVWVMLIDLRAGRRKNSVGWEYWACSIINGTHLTGAGIKNPSSTPQPKLTVTWLSYPLKNGFVSALAVVVADIINKEHKIFFIGRMISQIRIGRNIILLKNIIIVNVNKIGVFVLLAFEKIAVIMRGVGSVAQW